MTETFFAPQSDLAPWTSRHDWMFSPFVMTSNPPKYGAQCRRCGVHRSGFRSVFATLDCPGRIEVKESTS